MYSPFLKPVEAKKLLLVNVASAILYFVSLFFFQIGNVYLFSLLIFVGVFYLWQLLTLVHAAWQTKTSHPFDSNYKQPVDIYITVAGEPCSVVKETIDAALNVDYPFFNVYILNDGKVANKPNWRQIEELVEQYGPKVHCITRDVPGGAKAGNINNALNQTDSPFIAILDCDHKPAPMFLDKMIGYFVDERVGFVQSPQYYHNNTASYVANAAWQQQTLFFGPICRGKDRLNAQFMCGTNMVIRRKALVDVGGMCDKSITEDLLTSILMHTRGWKSVYVPMILAYGLAPEDLGSFWQQQYRWARGSLEVLIKYNPLVIKGLSVGQRIQYMASVTYYLTGLIVMVGAAMPLMYFFTGVVPLSSTTLAIGLVFLPYIFLTLYSLQRISNFAFSFRAIAFSIGCWPIFCLAFLASILRLPSSFKVTAKEREDGSYLRLASLHLLYFAAVISGITYSAMKYGVTMALVVNTCWALIYVVLFLPFVRAAMSQSMADRLPLNKFKMPSEDVANEPV